MSLNWLFGKKKTSPPEPQVDGTKEVEDGYLLVEDSSKESSTSLYPLITSTGAVDTTATGLERTEVQTHDNTHDSVHGDSASFLSGVPFVLARSDYSPNKIAEAQNFLYLTKRSTNVNNYCYDFTLELSIVNQ